MRSFVVALVVGLVASLACVAPVRAEKTDVVILNNDDHITGEIKSLERGLLKFKTDAADNLLIQWTDINRVTSKATFEIETKRGRRYFGELAPIDGNRELHVVGVLDSLVLDFNDVVYIVPIKGSFLARIDGSVEFGLSYTQANELLQWTFQGEVKYRAPRFYSRLSGSSTISDQTDVKRTSRQDLELRNTRFLFTRGITNAILGLMHNDELGVGLRMSASGSGGIYWLKTNSLLWGGMAGLAVTSERSTDGSDFSTQLEVPLIMDFETFTYHTPKRDITATFAFIPNLSDIQRIRTELNVKVRWELVEDLFVSLSALNSSDTRPPEGAQATNDLTLTFNVGYSF